MTWNVIMLAGPSDTFELANHVSTEMLTIPFGIPGHPETVASSVPAQFALYGIDPPAAAWDLLHATIAAYTADVRIPRRTGFDGWSRDIALYIPVEDPVDWEQGGPLFALFLGFLTGDHWTINIRQAPRDYIRPQSTVQRRYHLTARTASLFSGGMDSFIGAIDELAKTDKQTLLIGHHAKGGGPTSTSQTRAYEALTEHFSEERAPFMRLWVSPPKGSQRVSEITTRGRSALFLGLGVAAVAGIGGGTLIVPENGFISLNVPLTPSRIGSFSTRTTHPYLISLLRDLLHALHLSVELSLPYRFQTKGEMVRSAKNQAALAQGLKATMSCARPSIGRFSAARNPNLHCGYCLPCLIRRAAIASVGAEPTTYLEPDLAQLLSAARNSDLRALQMALLRYAAHKPSIGDILSAGPLPATDEELGMYLAMFRRAIVELRAFLDGTR